MCDVSIIQIMQRPFKAILKQMEAATVTVCNEKRRAHVGQQYQLKGSRPQEDLPSLLCVLALVPGAKVQHRRLQRGQLPCWPPLCSFDSPCWFGPTHIHSLLTVHASFRELMCAQSFRAGPSLRFMVLSRCSSESSRRACPSISWERNCSATSCPSGGETRHRMTPSS